MGSSLAGVSTQDPAPLPSPPPEVLGLPGGLIQFSVQVAARATVEVDVIFDGGLNGATRYYKFHDGTWIDYTANALFDADTVTLTLTDGGPGDADVDPNGEIVDPGGPAVVFGSNPQPIPPPTSSENVLRIKKRLFGDVPDGAEFAIRVRCFAADGDMEEEVLTFDRGGFVDVHMPAGHSRCRVREIDRGGAPTTTYRATSATAQTTSHRRSGWVTFGSSGGERAKVVVVNRWPGNN